MDLPGYKEALDLGYSLNYHGGDRKSATYTKDGIHLTIRYKKDNLEAYLEYIWKLLVIKTPNFTFPNKNFGIFENQVFLAKTRLEDE